MRHEDKTLLLTLNGLLWKLRNFWLTAGLKSVIIRLVITNFKTGAEKPCRK